MLADDRVDVGVNYDGDYFLAAATTAPARPFMTLTGGADDNQRAFFARQPRGGLLVTLAGAQHDSFTDLSYLESVFDGPVMPVEIGTIAPDAALAAQRAYTRAFLDHHLRGRPASALLTHATSDASPRRHGRGQVDARAPRGRRRDESTPRDHQIAAVAPATVIDGIRRALIAGTVSVPGGRLSLNGVVFRSGAPDLLVDGRLGGRRVLASVVQ